MLNKRTSYVKERFAAYGAGLQTGTPTYNLEVDTFGNVIETPTGDSRPLLSTPHVQIVREGQNANQHDRLYVGQMDKSEYAAVSARDPKIYLFRYKSGSKTRPPHSGNSGLRKQGYVHPSDWSSGSVTGRQSGGGAHHALNGATIASRPSEWIVTNPNRYDAVFEPELWFLDKDTKAQVFPIVPIATATGTEHANIGLSGHKARYTGSSPDNAKYMFADSTNTRGVQQQWFAFAFVINSLVDPRDRVIGPLSHPVLAEIWPRVKVAYSSCSPLNDLGRKIRLRH